MSRPPRLDSFDYTGPYRYFLTICTHGRRPCFTDADTVDLVLAQFRLTAREEEFEILAYCFMSDHLHLLVSGASDRADLTQFVKIAKQRAGFSFRRARGEILWQEGYYDHVLRDEDDTAAVARYIIENPVRAGLVTEPAEYLFWGSDVFTREQLLEFEERPLAWK